MCLVTARVMLLYHLFGSVGACTGESVSRGARRGLEPGSENRTKIYVSLEPYSRGAQ
jgi:hypothetical protein